MSDANDTAWMEALEAKVEEAVAEIERLRSENEGLRESLASARSGEGDEEDGGEAAWIEERDRVKARVADLVERLEDLLED